MSRPKSFHGTSLDEALSAACGGLGSRLEELHYDVVTGEGAEVVVEAEVDPVAVLGLFLSESFRAGELEITAHLADRDEALEGELGGGDLHLLTASGGRGLDALQYLCNRVLNRRLSDHRPVPTVQGVLRIPLLVANYLPLGWLSTSTQPSRNSGCWPQQGDPKPRCLLN